MRKKLIISGFILVLGGLGYWAASTAFRGQPACQVCARPIHTGQEYTLRLADGTHEHTCCPRCGLHFQLARPRHVQAAWATDYATAAKIEAQRAVYVEGSRLMTCCSTPPLKRELEVTYQLVWDRCLPSLIAFESPTEAQRFQQRYGGRILSYAEAVRYVKEQ